MRLEELDFEVPEGLIAQRPAEPRDSCRLMYLDAQGERSSRAVCRPSHVLEAGRHSRAQRLAGAARSAPSHEAHRGRRGTAVPAAGGWAVLRADGEVWEVLARPSHRLRPGTALTLPGGQTLTLRELLGEGRWLLEGPAGASMVALMDAYGTLPLASLHQDLSRRSLQLPDGLRRGARLGRGAHGRPALHPRAAGAPAALGGAFGLRDPARGPGHVPAHPRGGGRGASDPPGDLQRFSEAPCETIREHAPIGRPSRGRGHHGRPGARDPGGQGTSWRTRRGRDRSPVPPTSSSPRATVSGRWTCC